MKKNASEEYRRGYQAGYRQGCRERKIKPHSNLTYFPGTTTNISEYNIVDEFECERCGIIIHCSSIDRDIDREYEDVECEFAVKYCPNCGSEVIDE